MVLFCWVFFLLICLVLSGVFVVCCLFICFFLHRFNEVCPTSGLLDKVLLAVVQYLLTSFFIRTREDVMIAK